MLEDLQNVFIEVVGYNWQRDFLVIKQILQIILILFHFQTVNSFYFSICITDTS